MDSTDSFGEIIPLTFGSYFLRVERIASNAPGAVTISFAVNVLFSSYSGTLSLRNRIHVPASVSTQPGEMDRVRMPSDFSSAAYLVMTIAPAALLTE